MQKKQTLKDMKTLTATKKTPIFTADCSHFGRLESSYKPTMVNDVSYITYEVDYCKAIDKLHKYLSEEMSFCSNKLL